MSQLLSTSDPAYIELFKLHKLFDARYRVLLSSSESVSCYSEELSLEEAYRKEVVCASVFIRPTDPGFDLSVLGGDSGLRMSLTLHRVSSVSLDSSDGPHGPYTIGHASDIAIESVSVSRGVKLVLKKVILTFMGKYVASEAYAVYECLKFVDRELCNIFALSAKSVTDAAVSSGCCDYDSWSLCEQKSLEIALGRTKSLLNPVERWSAVSSIVKTKSAEECRRRYQRCRDQLLNKSSEHKKALEGLPDELQPVLSRSAALRFVDLDLSAISVFSVVSFVVQLSCRRCGDVFDSSISHVNSKAAVLSRCCANCHISHRIEFHPQLCFATQSVLGNLSLDNCHFKDFITGEFLVTCESCDTQCKVRDVQNGSCKRCNCRGCFSNLVLGFNSLEFGVSAEPVRESVSKKVSFAARTSRSSASVSRGLKVGTPLPDNGICKHYSKSFRWFRFPCCGKLFACDICHDEGSDHPYELANILVCGHCSTQQPVSNKKCRNCNRGYTGSSSSHWEGGKGCRDGVKLSRKDSKKYGLLRRQSEGLHSATRVRASCHGSKDGV
ncbi:Uncharacterized protein C18H10.09 [Babesia sp. Xinjiang]|uniref:Uncharacterized protein C18H10.09 n=1 Tax=Babesia sp. Xinjiang TaxID=462227 RepID=UPI000A23ECAA|nr:Uncharacterized protein C18H10.09 [Babesia sp. Xinjiang]ORM39633.1 Uncharacterized protein C18H10.09 [Babesia sp. Xinjiang]